MRRRSWIVVAGAAAAAAAFATAPSARAPAVLPVALPRAGDVTVVRFVVVARAGHAAPRLSLAAPLPSKRVGVFAWVGRDASDRARFDVVVVVVNPLEHGGRGRVGVSLGAGSWTARRAQSAANVVQPGRNLLCSDLYDIRSTPRALARGSVRGTPLRVFAAACALAADGPAPLAFVRSFGGFYCATSFVNDPAILRGPRWVASCTKPFSSAQLSVGREYDLVGADSAGSARCSAAGQTLTCAEPAEAPDLDAVLLLKPVPGESPSGTATIRRANGEHVTAVDVVQYPGQHQHG